MTKFLYLLVVIQTILLVVLFLKVDGFESELESAAAAPSVTAGSQEDIIEESSEPEASLNADMVRQIVREELWAAGSQAETEAEVPSVSYEMRVYDQVDLEYRRGLIMDEMELMKLEEEVSTADLNRLLGEIALLDPERRGEMLGMLNAAMNRGEINGQF